MALPTIAHPPANCPAMTAARTENSDRCIVFVDGVWRAGGVVNPVDLRAPFWAGRSCNVN